MSALVQALTDPPPCACDCHGTLTLAQRTQGIAALYRFDDAMAGWGYQPLYEMKAHRLFREAQARNDPGYRGIAVRDDACIYRRLLGFAVHEAIHALVGDPTRANHGVPFGAPYGVPLEVPPGEEKVFMAELNAQEARAFVGVPLMATALFGIDWAVYTARDVGTYGIVGGAALVPVPPGHRPVVHVGRTSNPERYYTAARRLETAALDWFTDERIEELVTAFRAAETRGKDHDPDRPDPQVLAARPPRVPGRNDLCPCGSGEKWKRCHGAAG